MKIAFISTMAGSPWGGSEELWAASALSALEAGHEVFISVFPHHATPQRLAELKRVGGKVFYNRPLNSNLWARTTRSLEWRLLGRREYFPIEQRSPFRDLFNHHPEIVCISQGANFSFLPLDDLIQFLKLTGCPYVVICQAAVDFETLSDSDRERAVDFFSNANEVCFVSKGNLDTTERQIAAQIKNSSIVRNPLNLSSLEVVSWPKSKTVHMATVARFEVLYKAHDVLLEALSQPQWASRDWELHLFGQGPDSRYISELIQHFQLDEKVKIVGYQNDVRSIWQQHQILLLPSRAEGIPLALVEAMICGRPSVVTDIAGNAEWVADGESGYIAEAPTPRSFAAALERAWACKDHWEKIGLNAHKTASMMIDDDPGKTLLNLIVTAVNAKNGRVQTSRSGF